MSYLKIPKILVVGDIMLDCYVEGTITRISPEANCPVFKEKNRIYYLGGAANTAANLSRLGAEVHLAGVIGKDYPGEILLKFLNGFKIIGSGIVRGDGATIQKIRLYPGQEQILRHDIEPENIQFKNLLLEEKFDLIVLSDYGKGVLTTNICQELIFTKIPVIVDPKGNDWSKYNGAAFIVPNQTELDLVLGELPVEILIEKHKFTGILCKQSERGYTFTGGNVSFSAPALQRNAIDVCGAGDSFVAGFVMAMSRNIPIRDACDFANRVASVAVKNKGTYVVGHEDFLPEFSYDLINHWRLNRQKILITNGCFDILHAGHLYFLQEVKKLGGKVLVAMNTDESIKKLKGDGRPINDFATRKSALLQLDCVDHVIAFDTEKELEALVWAINPDVLAKGEDYVGKTITGQQFAKKVILLPLLKHISSTNIIKSVTEKNDIQ